MISSTLENDVNPTGLNGVSTNDSQWISSDEVSSGVQLALTANPVPNWRIRARAAWRARERHDREQHLLRASFTTVEFNENSAGQVTYADGNVVYVNPTFNSKQLTVASTTAGAIPADRTTSMSTPGNAYYASPVAVTGVMATASAAYKVLFGGRRPGQHHQPCILTGKLGLPISAYQLNPALDGVTPAGKINVANAGDKTMGYPRYSLNLTNKYTFSGGWINGFSVGGTHWLRAGPATEYYY